MQRDMHQSDTNNFLRHRLPPFFPPVMSPKLSYAIDVNYFHEGNTNMLFYLWLNNYQEFWFFPIAFTYTYVQGYFWDGEKWVGSYVKREMIYAFF